MKTPKMIRLADGLELPAGEAAAQRYSIFGKPGSGKSNCAAVLVEGLLSAGEQVIILDPASIWWSLRVGRDGKTPAHDIAVMGGEHGDLPIVSSGGALVADALAGSSTSAVIDLSDLNLTEQRRFVTEFFEAFFHSKKRHRSPVLVVLEEAHEFVPQNVQPGEARMFGAIKRAAKIGRNYGIGLATIDHRPQEVNKAVVNLSEVLFTFQMLGAHERKAIAAWVNDNDPARAGLENELPGLPVGTAQVLSPGWLKIYGKFAFGLKRTYDAGKTPGRDAKPVHLKAIDIAGLRTKMAAVEEEAKASDPKALRAEVARLKRELEGAQRPPVAPPAPPKVINVEVQRIPPAILQRLGALTDTVSKTLGAIIAEGQAFNDTKAAIASDIAERLVARAAMKTPAFADYHREIRIPTPELKPDDRHRRALVAAHATSTIAKGERIVLSAIAQHAAGVSREQLSVLTGYKRSTRDKFLQHLAAAAFIDQSGSTITATESGVAELGSDFEPLPTGTRLREHWLERLPEGESRVLECAIGTYPAAISREAVDEQTSYKRSTRDKFIQHLASRKLVEAVGRGEIRASKELFD